MSDVATALRVFEADNDTKLVGERLRLRRQMRGLSLKQVADPAGISVGMLSQVEKRRGGRYGRQWTCR